MELNLNFDNIINNSDIDYSKNSSLKGVFVSLISLGCDKNTVDSENMLGQLGLGGCIFTGDIKKAQIIIINTCGFLQAAIKESELAVNSAIEQKKYGKARVVIVAGCATQRYRDEFMKGISEIDALIGVAEYSQILGIVESAFNKNIDKYINFSETDSHRFDESIFLNRILSTPKHYAYLKISEGCDKTCTYCIIPKIRGAYRSRTFDSLIDEAKILADMGVCELILVAQDSTLYGTDIYGYQRLHELLAELSKIDGISLLRILYCYPEHVYPELINEMSKNDKIAKYIDMPIQHASDRVLKLMGRRSNQDKILKTISELRNAMPDISIRTTLITGFPGEEKEDFKILIKFIEDAKFDRLGVFSYSREAGTPADKMQNHIEEKTKEARKNRLMKVQMNVSIQKAMEKIGKIMSAFIESYEDGFYIARSQYDAPDIDSIIYINSECKLKNGELVNIKIIDSREYDLIGELYEYSK